MKVGMIKFALMMEAASTFDVDKAVLDYTAQQPRKQPHPYFQP
jgi:hypothetical protein